MSIKMDENSDLLPARDTDSDDENPVKPHSIWNDIMIALYEARVTAPFVALLAFLLAYQLTIAPYRVTIDQSFKDVNSLQELSKIRPVLEGNEMAVIQRTTLFAETSFVLPSPSSDIIKIKFYQNVNKHGNHRLPAFFYDGVTFGIGSENPHKLEVCNYHFSTFLFHLNVSILLV